MKNKIERKLILAGNLHNFYEQLTDCLSQIKNILLDSDGLIIHQSFFVNSSSNKEYLEFYQLIYQEIEKFYPQIPSTSIIAQPPANGQFLTAEVNVLVNKSEELSVTFNELKGIHYVTLKDQHTRELYAGGITSKAFQDKFIVQVKQAYEHLQEILYNESFSFGDIVRQWNYVENILNIQENKDEQIQNYQVLNDIRSSFYAQSDFPNGYPAATAIGMNCGGLILEVYAIKSSEDIEILPVRNPKQIDAYHYSEEVLVGNAIEKYHQKATPKFERAKYISIFGNRIIFISGTAAVEKEKTIGIGNINLQTVTTFDNIVQLISVQNLEHSGIYSGMGMGYTYIRVYIKNASDISEIKEQCERHFGDAPIQYLIADVCRENLLLEIEGVAEAF